MADKQIKEKETPQSPSATVKVAEPKRVAKLATYEVLQPFRNTETKVMQEPGDEITVANGSRLKSLFKKGLLLNPDAATEAETETPPAE